MREGLSGAPPFLWQVLGGGLLKQQDREGVWHSWIPAAESGIVFQGDLCLTGKRKYYGEKEEAFCFYSFPHQQEKGRACGTRGKNWLCLFM